jgi:hypothetical protein
MKGLPRSRAFDVVKNTRLEARESATGRIREKIVTTYDLCDNGNFLSEWLTRRDAMQELRRLRGWHLSSCLWTGARWLCAADCRHHVIVDLSTP